MISYRLIVLAIVATLAIPSAGCGGEGSSRAAPAPTPGVPQLIRQGSQEYLELKTGDVPGMTWAEVKPIQLPGVLETTGQVTFDDRSVSTIISRVQGRIENVRVSLWDTVRKGQPIAQLYSPDLMTAESEYLQAQAVSRSGQTTEIAASLMAAAKRKLELLGMEPADIAAIREPSVAIWIRAPISGTVVENHAVRGAAVNPGDVLYTLGTLDPIWITADIYETDLARVRVGQELSAITTAYPDEVFKGTIARVSPNIDPNTHTLQIRCSIRNPGIRLKPQMLARVQIVTRPGEALVVPQEALVFDTDAYYAFVEAGSGRVARRKVAIASWSQSGYARVISGLSAGERVVAAESIQVQALWQQAHGESS